MGDAAVHCRKFRVQGEVTRWADAGDGIFGSYQEPYDETEWLCVDAKTVAEAGAELDKLVRGECRGVDKCVTTPLTGVVPEAVKQKEDSAWTRFWRAAGNGLVAFFMAPGKQCAESDSYSPCLD